MGKIFYIKDGYAQEFATVNALEDEDGCVIYSRLCDCSIGCVLTKCMVFDGDEINSCWQKGDLYYEFRAFHRVPDSWEGEDLRQGEVIYRPIKERKD